jgi:hypothetical protein
MEQGNNLLSFGLHVEGKFLKQRKLKKRVNKTDRQLTKEKKNRNFFFITKTLINFESQSLPRMR